MHSDPSPIGETTDVAPRTTHQHRPPSPSRHAPRRAALPRPRALPALSPVARSSPGADYVTIPVAAAMTGYTPKAIRRKIEAGVWLEGREFRRAPDGHVLISVKGYESWVERGRA